MAYPHTLGRREVLAFYHRQQDADRAVHELRQRDDHAVSDIHKVSAQTIRGILQDAEIGVSVVEIGALAWWGLIIGSILGAFWGAFTFSGRIPIPGLIAPTLSAGLVSVIFLWAGIFACIGWLIGALIPLFRGVRGTGQYEVRVTVPHETFTPIEDVLAAAGATDVITLQPR